MQQQLFIHNQAFETKKYLFYFFHSIKYITVFFFIAPYFICILYLNILFFLTSKNQRWMCLLHLSVNQNHSFQKPVFFLNSCFFPKIAFSRLNIYAIMLHFRAITIYSEVSHVYSLVLDIYDGKSGGIKFSYRLTRGFDD